MNSTYKLVLGFSLVLFLLSSINIATATVQPTLAINQSNDFISQYSEMNFSISEYSGQKSLNYLNITIPSGYVLSVPNVSGSQVGIWNQTQPITVITPTELSMGTAGNISIIGSLLSVHLFSGDNPFAVNTNDSTIILQLVPFIWQNPSAQGVKIWNYSMNLAGDPQLYTAFSFTVIRDYTTNINNNFTSNNQYISCSANVTLNSNTTLGVSVNLSTTLNNTNINVNNISLQTSINQSNFLNWSLVFDNNNTVNVQTYSINNISQAVNFSLVLDNNNSVAIVNMNNNTVVTAILNNNSVNNIVSCGSNSSAMQTFNATFDFSNTNNSISVWNAFNGTNILNASFWLSNNDTVLVTNYNNNTNFVDCSNNNTLAIMASSNATALLNASFALTNNNSIAIVNLNNDTVITAILNNNSIYNNIACGSNSSAAVMNDFNGTINFNASFYALWNNSLYNSISCNSNSSASIITNLNNTNIYNASISFWSNLTNYFNASFALTNNNSIALMALWNNTNNNLFNASFSLSNNNTWMLTNINNNTYYNINNITNINNATLICDPVNVNNGSSYDAPTYLITNTSVNTTVNLEPGLCPSAPPVTCTSSCPGTNATASGPLGGYTTPVAAGILTIGILLSTFFYLRKLNPPRKPDLPIKKNKTTANQLIEEDETYGIANSEQEFGEKPQVGGSQDSQPDPRIS